MKSDWVLFDRAKLRIIVRPPNRPEFVITKEDLLISYFSGGPGGQNVNRSRNGAQLIYLIPSSHRRAGSKTRQIVSRSMAQRRQHQNLIAAFEQLARKLHHYFYIPPVRKSTRPPRRAKERLLKAKKHHSQKKQLRGKVKYD